MNPIIKHIYRVKPAGKFKAFFTVELPEIGLVIWDCKLMQGDDGQFWMVPPTRMYIQNEQKKFQPIVEILNDILRLSITEAAREAFQG